jgi:hypothetical protein
MSKAQTPREWRAPIPPIRVPPCPGERRGPRYRLSTCRILFRARLRFCAPGLLSCALSLRPVYWD